MSRLEIAPPTPAVPHACAVVERRLRWLDEQSFSAAYDDFPQPVWLVDPASLRLLRVNPAMCTELGMRREELMNSTEADLCGPDDVQRLRAIYGTDEPGVWTTYGRQQRHAGGTFCGVQLQFTTVDYEGSPAKLVVAHSLRQRRKDTSQRQQIDILKSLVGNAGYGLGRYCLQTRRLVFFNQHLLDLMDSPEQVTEDLPAPSDQHSDYIEQSFANPEDWADFLRSARSRETYQKVILWRTQRGASRYVRLLSVPVETSAGLQMDLSAEDATDSVRREQHSRQSLKMEALGRMAGGVSHDFNNLLLVIRGHAELMEDSLPRNSELRRHTAKLITASRQAAEITGTLLTFSRGEEPLLGPLSLHKTIRGYAHLIPSLLGPGVILDMELCGEEFRILANATHVEQVILNLCINARDAMPDGGRVTVRTALVAAAREQDSGAVMIEISDTGIGMDAETRAHIFEPFYTTKARGKGTGLGLAVVYGIVTQYGGSIEVDTEVGKGTTFRIFFPLLEKYSPEKSGGASLITSATGAGAGAKKTVLLAEDEPEIRAMVGDFLKKLGHNVLPAAGGEEALALAAEHSAPIDMLLTDVMMPGMNGFELALKLRAQYPGLPVLVMSGFTGGAMAQRAKELGDAPFLSKPFSLRQIESSLKQLLG